MVPQKTKKLFKISLVTAAFLALTIIPAAECEWDIAPGWSFASPSPTATSTQPTTTPTETTQTPTPQPTEHTTPTPTQTTTPSPTTTAAPTPTEATKEGTEQPTDYTLIIIIASASVVVSLLFIAVKVRGDDTF